MKFNRRDFLLMGALAGAGIVFKDALNVTEQVANGVLSNAYAQQVGSKKLFSLFASDALPNWMFNLCLYPDAENIPSAYRIPGIGTGFDESNNTIFVQHKRGDYWFPKLWFVPVPTWNGTAVTASSSWVSPESLLDGFLGIRGMWNPSDGHQISHRVMYKPLGANYSVHGMLADASSNPIPGIVAGDSLIQKEFTSPRGINPTYNGSAGGIVTNIRDSFKQQVNLFRSNAGLDALVTNALNKFEQESRFKMSSSNFNRKKAEELVRANLSTLVTDYNNKRAKYMALISAACRYNPADPGSLIPGIFDVPLTEYSTGVLWDPDNPNDIAKKFAPSRDLRELFSTVPQLPSVADSFAMAEVMFENNLSSNIVSRISGFNIVSDIILDKATNLPFSSNTSFWGYDNGHSMGLSTQTLFFSVYARGLITCLQEFVTFLKAKNMYDTTVISLSSDFARSPQFNGKGSDHGWQANATSMWSGQIKAPTIVGDTMLDATAITGAAYKNLWGVGRKSSYLGNYIGVGNMNSTLTDLIGVTSNTSNNKSLIEVSTSGINPLVTAKTT